jgi:serine/threonine protein kinase
MIAEILRSKKYVLIKQIGNEKKRKFNELYLIQNAKSELFVCKCLCKLNSPDYIKEAFIHEAKLEFKCQFLPQNIDFHESEDYLYAIKKFIKGEPLDEFWKKIPSKSRIGFIKDFLNKIEDSFDEIRHKNLVHNDIKPSNFLIQGDINDFDVYLIDFGLSFYINSIPERKTLFSLGFSAPEIILNKLNLADHSSDLFSLACTFYFLFSGKPAFNHSNPAIMTNLQLTYPLINNARINHEVFDILSKMCAKENFKKPPISLSNDEIIEILKNGKKLRYHTIEEVKADFLKIKENNSSFFKSLFQFFRFRN